MKPDSRRWLPRLWNPIGATSRAIRGATLVPLVVIVAVAALLDTVLATFRVSFHLAPAEMLTLAGRVLAGWALCGLVAWSLVRIATALRTPDSRLAAQVAAVLGAAAAAAAVRTADGGLPAEGYVAYLGRLALVFGAAGVATAVSIWLRGAGRAWVWTTALGAGAVWVVLVPIDDAGVSPGLRPQPLDDAAAARSGRDRHARDGLAVGADDSPGGATRVVRQGSEPSRYVDPATAPDIILLTIDTWRADTLGQHPHSIAPGTAPTLERWAGQGQYYAAAMAPVPLTGPSHAAMFSGRSPWSTGHLLNGERVDASVPWAPEALRASGYTTAAFVGSAMLHGDLGFVRGFDVYDDDMDGLAGWRRTIWSALSPPLGARDDRHARWERPGERTLERIDHWLSRAPPDRPVFVWVHLYEPHAPYEPAAGAPGTLHAGALPDPEDYEGHPSFGRPGRKMPAGMAQMLDRAPTNRDAGRGVFEAPSRFLDPPGAGELSARRDELLAQAGAYLGEVRCADDLASELERLLQLRRSSRNRAWIVAGDHGESLTEHHEYASHQRHVYQANLAVPLMVLHAADRGEDSGSTVDVPVSLEGVSGTLLRLAGQDPGGFPELPTSDDLDPRDTGVDAPAAIVLGPDHGPLPGRRLKAAAWDGHYKLIAVAQVDAADAWEEWYDTRADPAETALLDPASLPADVTGRLRRTTSHVLGETQLIGERAPRDIPRSMREAMRALGYVEP